VDRAKKLVELAAFLVLNPGCTGEQVSEAMGGLGKPWAASTRHPAMSRLREWLGKTGGSEAHLPIVVGGRHRLAETVRSDWARFCELKERGLGRGRPAGVADLTRALGMVRGAPFAGVPHRRYPWADHVRAEMIDAVVDVAHTLAVWHTEPDPETEDLIEALLHPQRAQFNRISAGEGRG